MEMAEFAVEANSLEEMDSFVSMSPELKELYQEVLYDVRREIAYKTNDTFIDYDKIEKQIREVEEYGFQYRYEYLKKKLPKNLQEEAEQEEILRFNRMKSILRAYLQMGISYGMYKTLERYSFQNIKTEDKEVGEFLENFERIKKGEVVVYMASPIPDLLNRINRIYENHINQSLMKIENRNSLSASDVGKKFALSEAEIEGVNFYDAGDQFSIACKSMGYGKRFGDTYKEKWLSDDENFLYESKTLIREDCMNLFLPASAKLEKNWIVGYESLHGLEGMGSHDIDSNTGEKKEYTSNRKPCKQFSAFSDIDTLIYNTGLMNDENEMVGSVYNEIADHKYENGTKVMPDYLLFPYSSSSLSKFSAYQNERVKNAILAAKDLGNTNVVLLDIDRVAKNQLEQVKEHLKKWKQNHQIEDLKAMLVKIHNNRKGSYNKELFTDEFVFSILQDCYSFEDKQVRDLIDQEMLNMPNLKPSQYEDFIIKQEEVFLREKERKLEEVKDEINKLGNEEDTLSLASEESKGQLAKMEEELSALEKKIIKTKKVKAKIEEKKNALLEQKRRMKENVKEAVEKKAEEFGIHDLNSRENRTFAILEENYASLKRQIEMQKNTHKREFKLDTQAYDLNMIKNKWNAMRIQLEQMEQSVEEYNNSIKM